MTLPTFWFRFTLLFFGLLAIALLSVFYGAVTLSFSALASRESLDSTIFWQIRFPRTLVVVITGSLLAVIGAIMQSLFRNDLCSPFTLGVAATAGLGVHIAVLLVPAATQTVLLPFPLAGWLGALIGSFVTIFFSLLIPEPSKLLLVGICLNFFAASLTLALQYMADPGELFTVHRWLMGSFQGASYSLAAFLGATLLVLLLVGLLKSPTLDLLLFGDEFALSRGENPSRERILLLVFICFALSMSVACTGPITFIGLLSPHIARGLVGELHKRLIPVSLLIGGLLLVGGDLLARVLVAPFELPPSIITALIGVPGFIFLLLYPRSTR